MNTQDKVESGCACLKNQKKASVDGRGAEANRVWDAMGHKCHPEVLVNGKNLVSTSENFSKVTLF